MRRFAAILISLLLLCATSCVRELDPRPEQPSEQFEGLRIVGRTKPFGNVDVATKGIKSSEESRITNMLMLVVAKDGNDRIVDKQFVVSDKPLFSIISSNPKYAALTTDQKRNILIFIVANVPGAPDSYDPESPLTGCAPGSVYEQLMGDGCSVYNDIMQVSFPCPDGVEEPEIGFPMAGEAPELVDLTDLGTSKVIEIPLTCLYAKVVFNIRVDPTQKVDEVIQQFTLLNWSVTNIPQSVKIGEVAGETGAAVDTDVHEFTTVDTGQKFVQQGGSNVLSFSFYVPEHKVNKNNSTFRYPWSAERDDEYADYKQFFKPIFAKDNALKVQIIGQFKDHNEHVREVTYTLYPGLDNYIDFNLERDHQYNNNITIKGLTSKTFATEETVTFDYRVDVLQLEFDFGLQRETLLDSHWEIRPIRIRFDKSKVKTGYKIRVEIPEDERTHQVPSWLRMEMPSDSDIDGHPEYYCQIADPSDKQQMLAYGKRRYFTTDLVSSTLASGTSKTISFDPAKPDKEYAIWMYIDEYANKTDADNCYNGTHPGYRSAVVRCTLIDDHGNTVSYDYVFRQRNVYKVVENSHPYYIEYFEEYLYNFDVDDNFGNTSDGMEWGLDGVQLSNRYGAVAMGDPEWTNSGLISNVQSTIENTINNTVNGLRDEKKYDFYLTADVARIPNGSGNLTGRDRSGLAFTKEIIGQAEGKAGFSNRRATNQTAESAIEYCLNKNKRDNSNGAINTAGIKWYLPSIDEIEEITSGGYGEFEVFQNKLYWSSQPSFNKYSASFNGSYNSALGSWLSGGKVVMEGAYYIDDTARARATKTNVVNGVASNVDSGSNTDGVEFIWGTLEFTHSGTRTFSWSFSDVQKSEKKSSGSPTYDEGNCRRTGEEHRVRCVRSF